MRVEIGIEKGTKEPAIEIERQSGREREREGKSIFM
jgi:hypothetical protein